MLLFSAFQALMVGLKCATVVSVHADFLPFTSKIVEHSRYLPP